MNKYNEIINIEFNPKNHSRMSIYERSAQFAPFAALTGYEEKIEDANILDDTKINIDNDIIEKINSILVEISEKKLKKVNITYLYKNNNHQSYITKNLNVKKVDFINKYILIENTREKIYFEDIIDIKKPNS